MLKFTHFETERVSIIKLDRAFICYKCNNFKTTLKHMWEGHECQNQK